MMRPLWKSYRPDPFRFRPAGMKHWLYPFFFRENRVLMRYLWHIGPIHCPPQELERLKADALPATTLLVANHTHFQDPNIFFELQRRSGVLFQWMVGIEPFDTMRGLFGWHVQSCGGFSIDRGVIDRLALQAAQEVLSAGRHPLVIYPEGEADYTPGYLHPFYHGASALAIKAAQAQQHTPQPVRIVPLAIQYRLHEGMASRIRQDYGRLLTGLGVPPTVDQESRPLKDLFRHTLAVALASLGAEYAVEMTTAHPLVTRVGQVMQAMLEALHTEHEGCPAPQDVSYPDLMALKNKLRSRIARKRHAPPESDLETALAVTRAMQHKVERKGLSRWDRMKLSALEKRWIGVDALAQTDTKRLQSLERYLTQQIPFARLRAEASTETLSRWEKQMNATRQIKMLRLLQDDLIRDDNTLEGLEGSLVKLEILLFSRFVHRGPKTVHVRIGEPMDVKAFVAAFPESDPRARQEALTAQMSRAIQDLLETLPAATPLPVVSAPVRVPVFNAHTAGM